MIKLVEGLNLAYKEGNEMLLRIMDMSYRKGDVKDISFVPLCLLSYKELFLFV